MKNSPDIGWAHVTTKDGEKRIGYITSSKLAGCAMLRLRDVFERNHHLPMREITSIVSLTEAEAESACAAKTIELIRGEVCLHFGLSSADILAHRRTEYLSRARWVVMFFAREQGFSLQEIARALGLKDHGTVMYGCRRIQDFLEIKDDEITASVTFLRLRLQPFFKNKLIKKL